MIKRRLKYFFLILFVVSVAAPSLRADKIDSLKNVLPGSSGKQRLDILFTLANTLETTLPKEALAYAIEGIAIADQLSEKGMKATLYSSASFSSSELGDFMQALRYGYRSLELSTQIDDKKKMASANSTLGIAYTYMGQYSKSLEHHLEALQLRETIGLPVAEARTLNNIGVVYHNSGQYEKAVEYYQRAYQRHGPEIDTLVRVRLLTNIGYSEFKRGNFAEALRCHNEAMKMAEAVKYVSGLAYIYFNLGLMHAEKEEYPRSFDYLRRSLKNYESLGQKYGSLQLLNALGTTYFKTGNYAESRRYLLRAVEQAQQINALEQLRTSYETLHLIYEKNGPMSEAYRSFRLLSDVKDSLNNSRESKKMAELSMTFEVNSKEREIELLKKENTIAELGLDRQNLRFNFIVGGSVLLLVVISLLYVNNRKISAAKILVEQKNGELKRLNEELELKIGEVNLLSGLLPICSNCKKIRDDEGEWEQLEKYISHRSEATFSHGICPDCMKSLYGTVMDRMKNP